MRNVFVVSASHPAMPRPGGKGGLPRHSAERKSPQNGNKNTLWQQTSERYLGTYVPQWGIECRTYVGPAGSSPTECLLRAASAGPLTTVGCSSRSSPCFLMIGRTEIWRIGIHFFFISGWGRLQGIIYGTMNSPNTDRRPRNLCSGVADWRSRDWI